MSVYICVSVTEKITCDCSAYKFPHDVSKPLCTSSMPSTLSGISRRITPRSLAIVNKVLFIG